MCRLKTIGMLSKRSKSSEDYACTKKNCVRLVSSKCCRFYFGSKGAMVVFCGFLRWYSSSNCNSFRAEYRETGYVLGALYLAHRHVGPSGGIGGRVE